MIRSPLPVVALVLIACDGTFEPVTVRSTLRASLAVHVAPVAWVNGSFYHPVSRDESPDPELQSSGTFDAQLLADGSVGGHVRVRFHRPDGTQLIDLFEEVTCVVVAGHTAWVGTVAIREHLSPGEPSRLGRPVVWQVRDHGVDENYVQRRIDTTDCNARPELNLIRTLHGDLHVVDRR